MSIGDKQMREIKFRAWDKGKKKWIDNFDVSGCFGNVIVEGVVNTSTGTTGRWLHPEAVLCQFTGLKDKNGKEIYEGDIISYGVGNLPVYFNDGMFCYKNIDGDECGLYACITHGVEVIGNIYQNPELLEKEK